VLYQPYRKLVVIDGSDRLDAFPLHVKSHPAGKKTVEADKKNTQPSIAHSPRLLDGKDCLTCPCGPYEDISWLRRRKIEGGKLLIRQPDELALRACDLDADPDDLFHFRTQELANLPPPIHR